MTTAHAAAPDAVLVPDSWKKGNELEEKLSLVGHADRLLGLPEGRHAHLSLTTDGHGFGSGFPYRLAIRDPRQVNLYFPANHARKGQARYRFEPQPDGSRAGYFVDEEARHAYDSL